MGYSASATGLMYFSSIITAILCRFVAGFLGDKFRCIKFILLSSTTLCAVAQILATFIPRLPSDIASFMCDQNRTNVDLHMVGNVVIAEMGQLQKCQVISIQIIVCPQVY